jgi:hypothetical protein
VSTATATFPDAEALFTAMFWRAPRAEADGRHATRPVERRETRAVNADDTDARDRAALHRERASPRRASALRVTHRV